MAGIAAFFQHRFDVAEIVDLSVRKVRLYKADKRRRSQCTRTGEGADPCKHTSNVDESRCARQRWIEDRRLMCLAELLKAVEAFLDHVEAGGVTEADRVVGAEGHARDGRHFFTHQ